MAKPEWGTKRTCPSCGARFYDLRKNPAVCPKCSTKVKVDAGPKAKRPAKPVEETPAKPAPEADGGEDLDETAAASADEAEDDLGEVDDLADDEAEDIIEDTSDLGEDDDDMSEVIEHMDEDLEDKS